MKGEIEGDSHVKNEFISNNVTTEKRIGYTRNESNLTKLPHIWSIIWKTKHKTKKVFDIWMGGRTL